MNLQTNTPPSPTNPLCGSWKNIGEDGDDYYLTEYTISVVDGFFIVVGIDHNDGEQFEITDITWNGVTLSFHTYVKSTARSGICQMRYIGGGQTEILFTFTVIERWSKNDKDS